MIRSDPEVRRNTPGVQVVASGDSKRGHSCPHPLMPCLLYPASGVRVRQRRNRIRGPRFWQLHTTITFLVGPISQIRAFPLAFAGANVKCLFITRNSEHGVPDLFSRFFGCRLRGFQFFFIFTSSSRFRITGVIISTRTALFYIFLCVLASKAVL